MKTVTLTEAKRRLPELLQGGEPVAVTKRGEPLGTLPAMRFLTHTGASDAEHRKAARKLREFGRQAPVARTEAESSTVQLRKARERGEI